MKKKTVFFLLLIVALLAAGLTLGVTGAWKKDRADAGKAPAAEAGQEKESLGIDPGVGVTVEEEPEEEERGVAIPGWGTITLPAGEKEASVALSNPEDNKDRYYLTFELQLKETGETIFKTALVPPGESCNKVTLERELTAGEYAAVLHVQPYRMKDETPTNNADMETTLIVK